MATIGVLKLDYCTVHTKLFTVHSKKRKNLCKKEKINGDFDPQSQLCLLKYHITCDCTDDHMMITWGSHDEYMVPLQ